MRNITYLVLVLLSAGCFGSEPVTPDGVDVDGDAGAGSGHVWPKMMRDDAGNVLELDPLDDGADAAAMPGTDGGDEPIADAGSAQPPDSGAAPLDADAAVAVSGCADGSACSESALYPGEFYCFARASTSCPAGSVARDGLCRPVECSERKPCDDASALCVESDVHPGDFWCRPSADAVAVECAP